MSLEAVMREAQKWADQRYIGGRSPNGKNYDSVFGRWYPMNHQPYCDMFVSYCAEKGGEARPVGKFAYCPSHVQFFKNKGQWFGRNAQFKRGDVVFFSWDGGPTADHVGYVTHDSAPGQSVRTVEGNTVMGSGAGQGSGGSVCYKTRGRNVILGVGRPAYSSGGGGGGGETKPPTGGGKYRIKRGQTLTAIAALFGITVGGLLALNPDIKNPDRVNEGQEINVPAKGKPDPVKPDPTKPPVKPNPETSKPTTAKPDPDKGKPTTGTGGDKVTTKPTTPTTGKPDPVKPKPPAKWDGKSFPGADQFGPGKSGPHITKLGERLVAHGHGGAYAVGPDPVWRDADRTNTKAFQEAQGWRGSEADGLPGPHTWRLLMEAPKVKKPAPSCTCKSEAPPQPKKERDRAATQNEQTQRQAPKQYGNNLDGWIEAARAELAKNGDKVPSAAAIKARIMTESGGNPRAINLWDSNAKKGTPSKGLIQTIDPTFQAYRLKHLANDPYDPVANIVAGVRYANDRYGSFESIAFNKGGY